MKIAIFSICLGKYNVFFEKFYSSLQQHFLKNHEKDFIIISDSDLKSAPNIKVFRQPKLGWPYDTMMRFHFMVGLSDILKNYDYIFFLNLNMMAIKDIEENIIPGHFSNFLMGCKHPSYDLPPDQLPYERNTISSCCINQGEGKFYYQGCFNGGRSKEFLEMASILKENIDSDLKKNHIPLWHDESMLNWYYKDRTPLMLGSNYIHPEGDKTDKDIFMIQRNKTNYGGHHNLRN